MRLLKIMQIEEVKVRVSKLLNDEGFSNVVFLCVLKTDNTNIWNVVAKSNENKLEIILTDDGTIISKKKIKEHKAIIIEDAIQFSDKVSVTSTHEYVKKHPKKAALLISIFIISPIIGYFLHPLIGLISGFIIGGLTFALGSHETHHKDTRESS